MATLHIEHPIKDFTTWKQAFDRFADRRKEAGSTGQRIHQPHDNDRYVVLQLDFPTVDQAKAFLGFLETKIWNVPANSPALAGSPKVHVLTDAPV